MRTLSFVVLLALAPIPAIAGCPGGDVGQSGVQLSALQDSTHAMSVQERNEARLRAALGGDDEHATDADQ